MKDTALFPSPGNSYSTHRPLGHKSDPYAPQRGYVVCDIDGTLANIEHRVHYIRDRRKRYREFFAAATEDTIIEPVRAVLESVRKEQDSQVILVSGRSDEVAKETVEWLHKHGIVFDLLVMRREGDYTQDHELKRQWLREFPERDKIWLVIDDRDRVVRMWREEGLTCFQVAPGDF